MNGITLTRRDGTTFEVDVEEARDLFDQLEAMLAINDFWVDPTYVFQVLEKHGLSRNAAGLWSLMIYPHPDDPSFAAYTWLGKPTTIDTRVDGNFKLSARNILMNHGKFTKGYRRQFGTMYRRCFQVLVTQIRQDMRKRNMG